MNECHEQFLCVSVCVLTPQRPLCVFISLVGETDQHIKTAAFNIDFETSFTLELDWMLFLSSTSCDRSQWNRGDVERIAVARELGAVVPRGAAGVSDRLC